MSREHDYFVYMLTNATRSVLYIGVTNNLERRVSEHQQGHIPGFTRRYKVSRLICFEHFRQIQDALAREHQLKGWSRPKKNTLIARMNPRWADLSPTLDRQNPAVALLSAPDQPGEFITPTFLGGPSASLGMTNRENIDI